MVAQCKSSQKNIFKHPKFHKYRMNACNKFIASLLRKCQYGWKFEIAHLTGKISLNRFTCKKKHDTRQNAIPNKNTKSDNLLLKIANLLECVCVTLSNSVIIAQSIGSRTIRIEGWKSNFPIQHILFLSSNTLITLRLIWMFLVTKSGVLPINYMVMTFICIKL